MSEAKETISWGVFDDQKHLYDEFCAQLPHSIKEELKSHMETQHPDKQETCEHFVDNGIYAVQWLEKGVVTPRVFA